MVRSHQERHVPRKNFNVKSYLVGKNWKGSPHKSTSMQICIVRHDNFVLATLVETAGTFYMLQACMQGNLLQNVENSERFR